MDGNELTERVYKIHFEGDVVERLGQRDEGQRHILKTRTV